MATEIEREARRLLPEVAERIASVRDRIAAAARMSGRDPAATRLIVVTKNAQAAVALASHLAGADGLGENRADELVAKARALAEFEADHRRPEWHFVGHLQRNKVARVLPHIAWLHSLDSSRLAGEIARRRPDDGPPNLSALIEVNVAGEAQKHGVRPEDADSLCRDVLEAGLTPVGLMCMSPHGSSPDEARAVFGRLARLRGELAEQHPGLDLRELSMGMTDDFEPAVAEGSTMVRVGRAITAGLE